MGRYRDLPIVDRKIREPVAVSEYEKMIIQTNRPARSLLLSATAISLVLNSFAIAQEAPNAGNTVTIPVAPNTEPEARLPDATGFSLSLDGVAVTGDPQLEDRIRRTDIALSQANVQVTFDGLGVAPRLNVKAVGSNGAYSAGDTVTLQSEANYPAFIARTEMRLLDRAAVGGARLLGVIPAPVNGAVSFVLPQGEDIVVVHRAYDANGRFDETEGLSLMRRDERALSNAEEGTDFTALRNIPISGGAVTVSADGAAPGSVLRTLGEEVQADAQGRLVVQRILPPGEYDVDVSVQSNGRRTQLERPVVIPQSEWFYTAIADLTYGIYGEDLSADSETRTTGRLAGYVDGKTASGYRITGSIDTGEDELDELFERLDEKDPRAVLRRIGAEDGPLTFGDDSQIVDNTPTSGKFYLRVEKDGNFALWGDYQADLNGSGYLRNERTLYGAQASYDSATTTASGDARLSVDLYAAQPDQLVGREVFQGTGGSVYFLQRQDITIGSETLTVEQRDADTGRVIARQTLVAGRDYNINYLQGVITLYNPLTSYVNPNLIQTNPGGDVAVNLVSQYEYTPVSTDVDGFSQGGRVEAWANDHVRLGVTAMNDDTGIADQTSVGVDVRVQRGDNSFIQLDYAESDGPGYGSSFSSDGGVIIDNTAASAGSGSGFKLEGQAALSDFSDTRSGVVGGYYEERTQGFATLDYQVTAATGDETLYGVYAQSDADAALGYKIYADLYENTVGNEKTEVGAELLGDINTQLSYQVGVEYLDEVTGTTSGSRTDVAARLGYSPREGLTYSVFGQTALNADGLDEFNRAGVGVSAEVGTGWTLGAEVSDGSGGLGARVLASWSDDANNSTYFGYELDAGRAIDAGVASGDNGGKYILGGRHQVNADVAVVSENAYDIFGSARSLTGLYGVEYQRSDFLTYSAAVEVGQVEDDVNGDFDRHALSFGVRFDDADLTGRARIEYRQDRASNGSSRDDLDAVYLTADARYQIDENRRLLFRLDAAETISVEDSVLNGTLVDAQIGYAVRPIDNERLNVLANYRYLKDMFGQEIDGVAGTGPVQESHVADLQISYDLNREWTLGAKIGGRFTDSAPDGDTPLTSNDAWLAIANVRYNVVHNWDALIEVRYFDAVDAEASEVGALAAVYRHFGDNAKLGIGYNFSSFSDDLTDLTQDDQGLFINLVAKF